MDVEPERDLRPPGPSRPLGDRDRRAAAALGTDLSGVEVHDMGTAGRTPATAGLAAYTVGRHVVLDEQALGSSVVRDAVVAHELAHVAQQSGAAAPDVDGAGARSDAVEADADRAAPAAVAAMWGAARATAERPRLRTPLQLRGCPSEQVDTMKQREAELEKRKGELEAQTATGATGSFGEVGAAYAELKDVAHDLAVAKTGHGVYKGSKSGDTSATAKETDCTEIVFEVLRETFAQQGRSADWTKVEATYRKNIKRRGGSTGSGIDLQAALQAELGWKGIFWAPDPKFPYKTEHMAGRAHGIKGDEASYAATIAAKGTYYKDYGKKGYPGVKVAHLATGYGPEKGSTTTADRTGLDKLKKLPFGVMSAHGGYHMTIITYGRVFEVHWDKPSTSPDVVAQEPLETWAIGSQSGIRYFASGVIVAPAADVDTAFK